MRSGFARSLLAAALLSGAFTSGCAKWKKQREAREETPPAQLEVQTPATAEEPIRRELEELLERSKPIKSFTPELFVALTIKHRKETLRWLEDSKKMSEDDQKKYLENANRAFFEAFGTSEEAFIQYPQRHIDDLNDYINDHPELMKELSIED
jgi:hypothetical protein